MRIKKVVVSNNKSINGGISEKTKQYDIEENGKFVGKISVYENSFHNNHIYLSKNFEYREIEEKTKEFFFTIKDFFNKPIQVMIDSTETTIIKQLELAGFLCLRKSYEREFRISDFIYYSLEDIKENINKTHKGTKKYDELAHIAYEYYCKTHEDVSKYTSTFDNFCVKIPEDVYYSEVNETITNFTFIEENEICYMYGNTENNEYDTFIIKVINHLFSEYSTVFFEADNVDQWAMKTKELFTDENTKSYDTYVLK